MKKYMLIYIPASLLLCSMLVCCNFKKSENVAFEINKTNVIDVPNFNFSEFADSCVYVKLENQNNSLVVDVRDMFFVDNKLFVLNNNTMSGEKEILVFDNKGNFLNKIGIKGHGPGEYISISAFGVNSFLKIVVLLDPMNEEIHKYDYSGKFLESIPAKDEVSYIYKVRFRSANRMLCVHSINSNSSSLITESDIDLGNKKILFKTKFKYTGGYLYSKNPISSNGHLFAPPLSHTVYQYDDGTQSSALRVKYNNDYKPKKKVKRKDDFGDLFITAIKNGFSPIQGISETRDFILIQQFHQSILWDKKHEMGYTSSVTNATPTINDLIFDSNCYISGFDNGFAVLYPIDKIVSMKNYYDEHKIEPNKDIEKLLRRVDLNDNPYLCFYYLK